MDDDLHRRENRAARREGLTDHATRLGELTMHPPPWLLMLKGYPGSGKSTLAAALSRRFGWPLVDKDDIQACLDPLLPESDAPAYEIMFRIARRQLQHGPGVICDSPLWQATYENARALAEATGARLVIVECRCPDATLRRRIEARDSAALPPRRTTSWSALLAYRARYDAAPCAIAAQRLVVDTVVDPERLVDQIGRWLQQLAEAPAAPRGDPADGPVLR